MFHGRTSMLGGATSLWIPIREEKPENIFFDLEQERILVVKRKKNKALDKSSFEAELNRRIESMILPKQSPELQ